MECIIKILILEHDPNDLELLQYQLKRAGMQYEAQIVHTSEDYERALLQFRPDIILSDFSLPSFDGLAAFAVRQKLSPDTPFIIVSGAIGDERSVDLIKMGVTDYVLKDNMYQVGPKVLRAFNEAREHKERAIAQQKLRQREEQLKKIINQSVDVICTIDAQGRFVQVGAASLSVWGYAPQELVGRAFTELIDKADLENTRATYLAILNGLEVTNFENRYVRKDAQIVHMSWSARWDATDKLMYAVARDATEIKNTTRQLEEQNQQILDIFESITTGFLSIGRNWMVRYWNREAERMLGLDRSQVVNHNLWQVFPEAVFKKFYSEYHRILEQGIAASFEEYLPSVDLWLDVKAYPSKDGISVFFQDITESRRQEKLNQLEKAALDLYAGHNTPLVDIISFLLKGVGQIHPEMLGAVLRMKKGELYRWSAPLLPRSFTKCLRQIPVSPQGGIYGAAALRKEKIINADIASDPHGAHCRQLALEHQLKACSCFPVFDTQGAVLGILAIYLKSARPLKQAEERTIDRLLHILRNIIENKIAENAIRKSEKVRRLVMEASMDAIICVDIHGAVTLWNTQAERIFGWKEKEILGKNITDFIIPRQWRQKFETGLKHHLESGRTPVLNTLLEATALNRQQSEFPIEITILPIRQEGAEIFCAFIRDITERKEAEANRQQMTEDLYRQNKDLQQFTYIVSHNLRAPVANALGLTRLLTTLDKDDEAYDVSLAHLKTSVFHLDTVLKDINTILSIRDRQDVVEKEQVKIAEVLREAFYHLQEPLLRCGGKVTITLDEELSVSANRAYLYSIFYNLLSNAIKYRSEERPLQICIASCQRAEGGKTITFSDNGSGFDLEKAGANVFKLYKRFHTRKEGRGIGLHLVKTHLESMGGQIEVKSQVNVGTTFLIYLN